MESPLLDASSLSLDLNMTAHPGGFIKREFGPYKSTTHPPSSKQSSDKDEKGVVVLAAELSRVTEENQKLTQMLSVMCENFWALQSQFRELTGKTVDRDHQPTSSRKRKEESLISTTPAHNHRVPSADIGNGTTVNYSSQVAESTSSEESACKKQCTTPKTKISKLYVRTDPSDSTLVVKDGYQWRKYGQKVTRDNPCPRAYFKCSFAPSCPVKKKVQRSAEDRTLLVATYDGEHNHPHPSQPNLMTNNNSTTSSSHGGTSSTVPCALSLGSASPTVTLDFTTTSDKSPQLEKIIGPNARAAEGLSNQFLVEQMATSLVKDPNFATALAAAISGRILQPSPAGKW